MSIEDFVQAKVALDVNSDPEDVMRLSDAMKEQYGRFKSANGDTTLYDYWMYIKTGNKWKYIFIDRYSYTNNNRLNASNEEYLGCPKYAAKASDFTLFDWIVETDDVMDLVKENV